MKQWELNARHIAISLAGWLVATNILVWLTHLTGWWPCKMLLLVCLSLLPGFALLRALRIALGSFSVSLLYSFGLSVLVLMLSGLVANQVLYAFGMQRPLELIGALSTWNVVTACLIAAAIGINGRAMHLRRWRLQKIPKSVAATAGLSLILPFTALLGAFRLNNGGDASVAMMTLCFTVAFIVYAFLRRRHLPDGLLAWLMFVIGLTILLMTSLRGWDIVGHDIEREFRVFTLTHIHSHWDIGLDRDPYNACLSITILPEMFVKLLDTSGLVVFKFILQVVFAACPAVLYLLLRQYASKLGALTGSMLFICYPTFINDSAMLTRQGVAYLFFALSLLVLSNRAQKKRYKILFLLCATGAVLSHYSTAYMFVALFAIAALSKWGLARWQRRRGSSELEPYAQRTVLSPLFAGLLFLMTFMWYTQITGTSGGLATTLNTSLANIPKMFSDDNKSSDTGAALLFAGGKTQADLYLSYLTHSHTNSESDAADTAANTPSLTSDDLPLTPLGEKARSIGLEPSLINLVRQNFAKVLQILALTGVLFVVYRLLRKKSDAIELDFVCVSFASIVLLALMVLLPVLSINYGILRAFQQALLFLILPITLLVVSVGQRLPGRLRVTVATLSIVSLFCVFSGLLGQALGGVSPSLSMNNRGLYYGLYYSPEADSRAFQWLKEYIPKDSNVRAANFNRALMHDPDYPFTKPGILPSQISPRSFVYLDQAQVITQKFYTYYQSSPLIMEFPLNYYDMTKNHIYSTASTRIYK